MELGQACAQLREGRIGRREFEVHTRDARRRLARHLAKRWRQPSWADVEDVELDLLAGMARFAFEWEPDRPGGASLEGYVVYNACDKAKKAIHRRRGASLSGNADANPSVFERPLSAYGRDGEDDDGEGARERLLARVATQPPQEEAAEAAQVVGRALAACRTESERISIRLLAAEGSLDRAAVRVYATVAWRRVCAVRSEGEALRVVARAAMVVAARLQAG